MTTATSTLGKVHARDIMKRNVFKLEPTSTIDEAVTAFQELQIGGAPVVDRSGRLLGVLSSSDIARPENMRSGHVDVQRGDYTMGEASPDDDGSYDEEVVFSMEDYSPGLLSGTSVADLMNTDVVTVSPDATLKQIRKQLVKEHAHRVVVVERGKLVGIVSTLNVARCVSDSL
ncbi:MAG: CBS domain-containing protein [Planctomycetota bacterium]